MADSNTIEITSKNFSEKALQAPQMVVVAFLTKRSEACQILEPEYEKVSKDFQGRVTFARIDIDEEPALTSEWNIDGIPTMVFFNGGKEIYRVKGIVMRDKLRRQVEGALLAT